MRAICSVPSVRQIGVMVTHKESMIQPFGRGREWSFHGPGYVVDAKAGLCCDRYVEAERKSYPKEGRYVAMNWAMSLFNCSA